MNLLSVRAIPGALFSLIVLIVVFKCVMLNRIDFDMDKLKQQLQPIINHVQTNSTIGFYSNDKPGTFEAYQEMKSMIAPATFVNKLTDTIILFQRKNLPLINPPGYRCVAVSTGAGSTISLLVK
jgi:hypothetical protein